MSENEQVEEYQQEYPQENYEWEEEIDYSLQHAPSQEKPYNVYQLDELIHKIKQENQQKTYLTCLPEEWNLMLYSFCDFNEDQLNNVIDQEQTGRKMIRYLEGYEAKEQIGVCYICCEQSKMVINPCGHGFCIECWRDFLLVHHTDREQYDLFPMCPEEGCFHRTNLLLIQKIWTYFPNLKAPFERLLCQNYARKSDRVKLCPQKGCNKAILINLALDSILTCECGSKICRFCGEYDHFPLNCPDLRVWNDMVNKKENQWLNELVTQQCPMCKTFIDKNGGCIHMTCRCKYQFCWICLKVWKGHTNYGECNNIKKEDHQQRLKDEQDKKKHNEGEYSVRFEEAKSEVERVDSILKRVNEYQMNQVTWKLNEYHILTNDTARLLQFRDTLLEVFKFYRNCTIYIFLQLQGCNLLKCQTNILSNKASTLDDYLTKKLGVIGQANKLFEELQILDQESLANINNEIKEKFFQGKDYHLEQLKQIKKNYNQLREGHFMNNLIK